jgi:hypothetical protein
MHIRKLNAVSGSIHIDCRESLSCKMKVNFEWETNEILCFHYAVNHSDNNTGSFDQQETKNRVHAHLESGGNDKRGWASIFGEVQQVELKPHGEISGESLCIILYNSRENNRGIILKKEDLHSVGTALQ